VLPAKEIEKLFSLFTFYVVLDYKVGSPPPALTWPSASPIFGPGTRWIMSVATRTDIDLETRRASAVSLTKIAVRRLAEIGVSAKVMGSLPAGRFKEHSDIDLLVTDCPRHLKYRIEGLVEDCLPGFRFDVVYLDEIPSHRLHRFLENVTDARDLR
jgi:predicted nucleotidyltransferase